MTPKAPRPSLTPPAAQAGGAPVAPDAPNGRPPFADVPDMVMHVLGGGDLYGAQIVTAEGKAVHFSLNPSPEHCEEELHAVAERQGLAPGWQVQPATPHEVSAMLLHMVDGGPRLLRGLVKRVELRPGQTPPSTTVELMKALGAQLGQPEVRSLICELSLVGPGGGAQA